MVQISEIQPNEAPMSLLLLADPSERAIRAYLEQSRCFAAILNGSVIGVCLLKPIENGWVELMNIPVEPLHQQKGLGAELLRNTIELTRATGAKGIEVGTGTFGYPLTFYQRHGFRVSRIDKDFFLNHYSAPIIENGIQHKYMIRLAIEFR